MRNTEFWKLHTAAFARYIYDEWKSFCIEIDGPTPTFTSFENMFFQEILDRYKKLNGLTKKEYPQRRYLLTFTFNPNTQYTKEEFKSAVIKQLQRKVIAEGSYAFEHEDSNIHCHALVTSTHPLTKSNFNSHIRKFGHMDIKSITEDNGILDYITKEATAVAINSSSPPLGRGNEKL